MTDSSPSPKVKIAAFAIILIVFYGLLAISDYLLAEYVEFLSTNINKEAKAREKAREPEDAELIQRARADGFGPLLYPQLFETQPFVELVTKYGIAPLASSPNTKIFYCNEGYGLIKYTSDRFGFRNIDSIWNEQKIDWVLIGDSFAQGACVEGKDTIAGVLSSNGQKVINLATASNEPMHYASLAKTFLKYIRPKYVVVVFYANDNVDERKSIYHSIFFERSPRYFGNSDDRGMPLALSPELSKLYQDAAIMAQQLESAKQAAELHHEQQSTPSTPDAKDEIIRHLRLENIRKILSHRVPKGPEAPPFSTKLAIDAVITECATLGCISVIVYIPSSDYWRPDFRSKGYAASIKNYLSTFKSGPQFIDTSDRLAALGLSAYAINGPHLSIRGYKIVADAISEKTALLAK